jgi:hypothetical protein
MIAWILLVLAGWLLAGFVVGVVFGKAAKRHADLAPTYPRWEDDDETSA